MPDEPTFPAEAQVGSTSPGDDSKEPAAADAKRKRQMVGVAAGIGSAAIVAALLYAKSGRRNDRKETE